VSRISGWAVWRLPRPAAILVASVVGAYLGAVAIGGRQLIIGVVDGSAPGRHLVQSAALTGGFALGAVISAEISMRLAWPRARQDRISRDLLTVWILPIALLLPPVYVMVAVIIPCAYLQLRIWRGQPIKRIYSTAALGLAYGGASLVHRELVHAMSHIPDAAQFSSSAHVGVALGLAVAACWTINAALINGVVVLTAGTDTLRGFLHDYDGLFVDLVALCLGALVAVLWATDRMFAVLLLPPVLLLQHNLFSGLRQAVRTDLLTDVANPQFWREVASREIDRATASDDPLAILMIDVDHFKLVNDRYGHLAGDDVLAAVARAIAQALRPRDLVGRLGGEEFGAVLSGLTLLEAERAADRLRIHVGDVRVRADGGDWIAVTVSVGVSELSITGGNLHLLLDAADTALYAAKAAGRNCVRVAVREPAGPGADRVIDLTDANDAVPTAPDRP
jgi:diguanylate cyclase (GGDEF)-like protein